MQGSTNTTWNVIFSDSLCLAEEGLRQEWLKHKIKDQNICFESVFKIINLTSISKKVKTIHCITDCSFTSIGHWGGGGGVCGKKEKQ
jgi:hypothetical protein